MSAVESEKVLELCHDVDKPCDKCDLVYIIKDYIYPLMQLLTNDMNDFNIQMRTSKCLNTGLMLMYFMAGQKGIDIVKQCDCSKTAEQKPNNGMLLKTLSSKLRNRNFKNRHLYYVLLTDAHIHSENDVMTTYFPGHVFIFEKFKDIGGVYFNVYQSYNKEYDLKEYIEEKMKKDNVTETVKISSNDVSNIMRGLSYLLSSNVWDDTCIKFWKLFTHVDSSMYRNKIIKNKIFMCYGSARVDSCVSNIREYLNKKINQVHTIEAHKQYDIYGDVDKYVDRTKALTVSEIKIKLHELLKKTTIKQDL